MKEQKQENQFSGMTREEIVLEARKQILRSAVLALAALIVIGVACYAWFVSTKVVTANVGMVSMGDMTFDLASAGSLSAFDTPTDYTVPEGNAYDGLFGSGTWTFQNQTIQWRMTGKDNLGNFQGDEQTEPEGLRPGMSGQLSFYVIPHGNGPLQVRFNLSIVPLKEIVSEVGTTSSWQEVSDNSTAARLLRGHLLFAVPQSCENGVPAKNPGMTLANYTDGSFTINFGTVEENALIPVTLEWCWYNTLSDALSSSYADSIIAWMKEAPDAFFYNGGTVEEIPADASKDTIQADSELNNYFNDADYYIGNSIDAIILRLNAQK